MRFTFRLFMAAILFTVTAGFASAQEASAPPPPPAPDVTVPVVELPPIPVAEPVPYPNAPPVEPALTIDQSALPVEPAAVEPAAVVEPAVVAPAAVAVEPPAPEKAVATTTTRRMTRKAIKKPVQEQLGVEPKETVDPAGAAAAAGTGGVGTTANMPPPPDAAASTAPARSVAPPPAAVESVVIENPAEGTESQISMGIGGWLLAGIVVAGMVGIITLLRRRRTNKRTSIVDLAASSPDLIPVTVTLP